jgi:dihydropteroate synthase-like protein
MVEKIFITGKLAFPSLKNTLERLELAYDYSILKMPITVAALMDTKFIIKNFNKNAKKYLNSNKEIEIIIPGRSQAEIEKISKEFKNSKLKFTKGPQEIMDIAEFLGKEKITIDIEKENRSNKIIAEINEAALMSVDDIIKKADHYIKSGADIIDIGCVNGRDFPHLEKTIKILKKKGYKTSIDTFNVEEIKRAETSGVDYLLSINGHNISAVDNNTSFTPVIIPDPEEGDLDSLYDNIRKVENRGCFDFIIDPILDPVNFGFSDSIFRYLNLSKNKDIKHEKMMGVGNLIELSDCDSTGLNFLAAALAVELDIKYLLTTEASFKTIGAVKELDLALRIINYSNQENSLPNNISNLLLNLKDRKNQNYKRKEIAEIKNSVIDSNYRILNDDNHINIFNGHENYQGRDINILFNQLSYVNENSHAFYLGRELQKAYTALKLNKNYRQEDELDWGYLNKIFEDEKNDN